MKTIRRGAFVGLALLATGTLPASRAEANGFNSYSELSTYYLQQRVSIAPIIPPLLPSSLETLEAMILKGDYSFQDLDGWYFGWADGPHTVGGELADYDGQTLVVYEDLATASIKIGTSEGKVLASFKSDAFPNLNALKGDEYEQALLAELNKRSVTFWVSFEQPADSFASSFAAPSFGGGYSMMSMGGLYELEVIDLGVTNDGVAVTFAWPQGDFTNRLDIYAYDGAAYNGLGSWKLADIGFGTAGTNQLRWVDTGQMGRGSPLDSGIRLYTAGKGGDVDSDGDGYADSYEHLVINTDPNNPDTDGDNVSDGPFDPDNTGAIVAGPDVFPLDASEWADTDGDEIGDNADSDDDGDGMADGQDAAPTQPVTVARLKTATVETANPVGDTGAEVFDVSSSGRPLPFASGSQSREGFGRLHGGIFFNNDGTNLYIGIAGLENTFDVGNNGKNAFMLFLDTDSTNGGAASLSGVSGTPNAFGIANNLSFSSNSFTPNVGILVGSKYGDGQNFSSFSIKSEDFGQGVYALSSSSASDLTGFSGTGRPISQWGDRDDSANAGIEIAIPLSSLGISAGDYFKAAAIFCHTNNGTSRWLSREAYGESVTGTTANTSSFGYNTVTLIGSLVYLSSQAATPSNPPPAANDNDVIMQGFYWNVSKPPQGYFTSMTVAGSLNGWDAGLNNMTLVGDETWEYVHYFTNATGVEFKFVANGSWGSGFNWGETNQSVRYPPINQQFAEYVGGNISLTGTINGPIRFRFNSGSQLYDVSTATTGSVPTYLPGFASKRWYSQMTEKVQSNEFSRFTMIWLPPPSKANSGSGSAGYDPYDQYDLGKYNAKGTTATLYGTEAELQTLANTLNARGIVPMVDLVLNHMAGGSNAESGVGRYNYQPTAHETFEKVDPAGNNSNGYFNVATMGEPFSYDWGHGAANETADLNQENAYIRQGLKNWGAWASAKVGYRGYRWDFTQGIEPWFIPEFMNYSLMKDRFSVMEYWTDARESTVREHATWLALTDYASSSFDFPLREKLRLMCDLSGTFNMYELSRGGLVHSYPQWACTFAESHDTARAYGGDGSKFGLLKNKEMAYAYILWAGGNPCVFYHDYFEQPYADQFTTNGWNGTPLKSLIDPLIDARHNYAGGTTSYLSTMNTNDLYIAKRNGTDAKPGCIIVINDNMTTTLYDTGVNTGWASTNLVDVLQTNQIVSTDAGGIVQAPGLSASPRGYRIYVRQGDL